MNLVRKFSSIQIEPITVSLIGAAGGIGKPLALLLKMNPRVAKINLYDVSNTKGIREDLSHINTKAEVEAFSGEKYLKAAVQCSQIVVILAGQAHSSKFTSREAMFTANADLIVQWIEAIMQSNNEQPFIHIVTNPVNALVPLAAEVLKTTGKYDPRKLSGSTSIDLMRARTFVANKTAKDPTKIWVPVIGGHSANSIVPIISQTKPHIEINESVQKQLCKRIINGANEVVAAKNEQGAAQLSLAICISKFVDSITRAMHGAKDIYEVAYVPSKIDQLPYFSSKFQFDTDGIKRYLPLPAMLDHEEEMYKKALSDIDTSIENALEYFKKYKERSRSKA